MLESLILLKDCPNDPVNFRTSLGIKPNPVDEKQRGGTSRRGKTRSEYTLDLEGIDAKLDAINKNHIMPLKIEAAEPTKQQQQKETEKEKEKEKEKQQQQQAQEASDRKWERRHTTNQPPAKSAFLAEAVVFNDGRDRRNTIGTQREFR